MNRGVFQSSPVQQQVMGGGSGWWSLPNMRPPSQENPSSISPLLQLPRASTPFPMAPWQDNQEQLPESWSQLLLGGLMGEEERCSFSAILQPKRLENWEEQMMFQQATSGGNLVDQVKQEGSGGSGYAFGNSSEEIQVSNRTQWSHQLPPVPPSPPCVTSPASCITTFNSNMLDFSSGKVDGRHPKAELSPECNSTATGSAVKKARVQGSSSSSTSSSSSLQSTFKVRKEKLGDRITALHQLVSPFGKTDTASVLLEAIGYIRFLQNQIEALSSPYLGNAPSSARLSSSGHGERGCIFPEDPGQLLNDACMKRQGAPEHDQKVVSFEVMNIPKKIIEDPENIPKKDLRSRGLCLVPISCTMHMDSDNSADFWAPTIGGTFR